MTYNTSSSLDEPNWTDNADFGSFQDRLYQLSRSEWVPSSLMLCSNNSKRWQQSFPSSTNPHNGRRRLESIFEISKWATHWSRKHQQKRKFVSQVESNKIQVMEEQLQFTHENWCCGSCKRQVSCYAVALQFGWWIREVMFSSPIRREEIREFSADCVCGVETWWRIKFIRSSKLLLWNFSC